MEGQIERNTMPESRKQESDGVIEKWIEGGRKEGKRHIPEAEEAPWQVADAFELIVDVELRSHEDEAEGMDGGREGGKAWSEPILSDFRDMCGRICTPRTRPPSFPPCSLTRKCRQQR